MFEALWLLLPVAAASGWISARRSGSRFDIEPPSEYYQGINYLLNRQEDKAIDVFLRQAEVDDDAAETHLALGSLFRQRGDVERAIRMHKDLIGRPGLRKRTRDESRLELARDYFASGLLDWAEEALQELINDGVLVEAAYEQLIGIYEREKEWQQALAAAETCQRQTDLDLAARAVHFHCELHEQALRSGDTDRAADHLDRAEALGPTVARVWCLRAEAARRAGDMRGAVQHYEMVVSLDEGMVPEVAEHLLSALTATGDERQIRAYLNKLRHQPNTYTMVSTAAGLIAKFENTRSARQFFKDQLLQRPSLPGLTHWARAEMESGSSETRAQVGVIVEMLERLMAKRPTHACRVCSYRGHQLYWLCPGCHSWDSIRPIMGDDGE
ncbi:MAG: tetratricopeptide repeat protein [Pseudomonadota bacterium]